MGYFCFCEQTLGSNALTNLRLVKNRFVVWYRLPFQVSLCSPLHPVLREHGIKGMMQDRNFVTIILSLIGQHCPDVSPWHVQYVW